MARYTKAELVLKAADAGLKVDDYSPGDGVTRYRFAPGDDPGSDYFGFQHALWTAAGLREASTWLWGYRQARSVLLATAPAPTPATVHLVVEEHETGSNANGDTYCVLEAFESEVDATRYIEGWRKQHAKSCGMSWGPDDDWCTCGEGVSQEEVAVIS